MWYLKKTMIQPELYSCNRQHKEDHCTITVGDCVQYLLSASARGFNSSGVKRERGGELMYSHVYVDAFIHVRGSLGSRPSPYVRVLIARGWANRSSGKAWDDSSREA